MLAMKYMRPKCGAKKGVLTGGYTLPLDPTVMNGGVATLECPEIHSVYYAERFPILFRGRMQGYVKLCVWKHV